MQTKVSKNWLTLSLIGGGGGGNALLFLKAVSQKVFNLKKFRKISYSTGIISALKLY
jgi:hypothetical protein